MDNIYNYKNVDSVIRHIPLNVDTLLLGESTHSTEEFYNIRKEITQNYIEHYNFNLLLLECDWLNLYKINKLIENKNDETKISDLLNKNKSFPKWMWNNKQIVDLFEWINDFNKKNSRKVYILGIDCYLLVESIEYIIDFLLKIDTDYGEKVNESLDIFKNLNTVNSFMNFIMNYDDKNIIQYYEQYFQNLLIQIQNNYDEYTIRCIEKDIDLFDLITLEQSAEVVISSFEYFKKQYTEPDGSNVSWNTRDQHMLMTVMKIKEKFCDSKVIIWAHNSHIGDSTATKNGGDIFENNDMWNLGQMCRSMFENTFILGFLTYNGSVLAAEKMNDKSKELILNLPISDSIEEQIYHLIQKKNLKNSIINLNKLKKQNPFNIYTKQRMIGVIYNHQNEIQSHYIESIISNQYNMIIFISHTTHLIT